MIIFGTLEGGGFQKNTLQSMSGKGQEYTKEKKNVNKLHDIYLKQD